MSGATARRKGNTAEVAVVRTLQQHGHPAQTTRAARGGTQAGADIWIPGLPWLALEIKNHRQMDLAGWVDQAVRQAADAQLPVVVAKRRGRADPNHWYAIAPFGQLLDRLTDTDR